jgi:hypothetical protein
MANLALILFAPWFAILGWAYWTFPRSHLRTAARRRFDVIALVLAVSASAVAMRWAYFLPFEGVGAMWPQVIATLFAYHAFVLVLVIAWFGRARLYKDRQASVDEAITPRR